MTWKDVTVYKRGENKAEATPRQWNLELGDDRYPPTITIHRSIYETADTWLVSFRALGIKDHRLISKDADDAKDEAVKIVRDKVKVIAALIDKMPKKKRAKKGKKKAVKKKAVKE